MQPVVKTTSKSSLASMILGIVGLVFIWVPIFGLISALPGIVFGGIGLYKTNRDPYLSGRGFAITGLVCGIIGTGLWIILVAIIGLFGFLSYSTATGF